MPTVSYKFKWPSSDPSEVLVTGSFDNWSKSVRLDKRDNSFEKTVEIPVSPGLNIHYKFVVDGEWKTDPSAPLEQDEHNNFNNVLSSASLLDLMSSSAAPFSSTAALAANVPLEPESTEDSKGGASTTAAGHSSSGPVSSADKSDDWAANALAEIDATRDSVKTSADSNTTPTHHSSDQNNDPAANSSEPTFSVSPIPASSENAPSYQPAAVDAHVTLDQESYENAKDTMAEQYFADLEKKKAQSEQPDHGTHLHDDKKESEDVNPTFSVAPIPAAEGNAPYVGTAGADKDVTLSEEDYHKHSDPYAEAFFAKKKEAQEGENGAGSEQTFSVSPLPAAVGNVPAAATASADKDVTLDEDSYNNYEDKYALQELAEIEAKKKASAATEKPSEGEDSSNREGAAISVPTPVPSAGTTAAPNSTVTIQSAAPFSTTAALAASVPLEPPREAVVIHKSDNRALVTGQESHENDEARHTTSTEEDSSDKQEHKDGAVHTLSSAAPHSTTAALAAKVPFETSSESNDKASSGEGAHTLSSAAPHSTTAELAAKVPFESSEDKTNKLGPQDDGTVHTLSSAAPHSTTADLAAKVPLECPPTAHSHKDTEGAHTLSSAAPQSTTAALAANVPLEPSATDSATSHKAESTKAGSVKAGSAKEGPLHTLSSAAPHSTTAELAAKVPLEPSERTSTSTRATNATAPGGGATTGSMVDRAANAVVGGSGASNGHGHGHGEGEGDVKGAGAGAGSASASGKGTPGTASPTESEKKKKKRRSVFGFGWLKDKLFTKPSA